MGNASQVYQDGAYGHAENVANPPPQPVPIPSSDDSGYFCRAFIDDGLAICHGTQLRGKFKGAYAYGWINDGVLEIGGRRYYSLCAALHAVTRRNLDHWLFWECRLPGETEWQSLCGLKVGADTPTP